VLNTGSTSISLRERKSKKTETERRKKRKTDRVVGVNDFLLVPLLPRGKGSLQRRRFNTHLRKKAPLTCPSRQIERWTGTQRIYPSRKKAHHKSPETWMNEVFGRRNSQKGEHRIEYRRQNPPGGKFSRTRCNPDIK